MEEFIQGAISTELDVLDIERKPLKQALSKTLLEIIKTIKGMVNLLFLIMRNNISLMETPGSVKMGHQSLFSSTPRNRKLRLT